jgi:hypothetical protein
MLPILAIGALYLRHKRLPKSVTPNRLATALLWVAGIVIIVAVGYSLGRELLAVIARAVGN